MEIIKTILRGIWKVIAYIGDLLLGDHDFDKADIYDMTFPDKSKDNKTP